MKKLETIAIEPRYQCLHYMKKNESNPKLLIKSEFDDLARKNQFAEGPYRDTFGDNPGDPYNPDRQAFGKLKDGRYIYCELNESKSNE